jgi:hypothetical protein
MADIRQSTRDYEDWLRRQLGRDVVEADLASKHDKMRESPFAFLRATYWRWAETVLQVCTDAGNAPQVLAVGDIHLENFGTWRDADGRLVWGVNDYDEAAAMPYVVDLIRLAASALVAVDPPAVPPPQICPAILAGYRQGLGAPQPVVLDRDMQWLRELVVVSEKQRAKFWNKIDDLKRETAPVRYRKALASAMPEPRLDIATARRSAGAGSLGRPRWIGIGDWRGAPVVREAKALLPSSWSRAGSNAEEILAGDIASGRFRAMDPWCSIADAIVVRRLSPNNRKIEADKDVAALLSSDMLQTMGRELASVHLGTADKRSAIARDLARRKRGWLKTSATRMAAAVASDHAAWKAG